MTEVKKDSANYRLTGNYRPYYPTVFPILAWIEGVCPEMSSLILFRDLCL